MNFCDLQTVIQVPFEQRRIKKNLFGFHYTKKFLVVFDHFSPCVDFVIFHVLWYLVLRDFRNHEKRTEFRKNAYAFAPGLLCLLQKIQKVCRLEHSVLFRLALQGLHLKTFSFPQGISWPEQKRYKEFASRPRTDRQVFASASLYI